jgi:hypothetical protein
MIRLELDNQVIIFPSLTDFFSPEDLGEMFPESSVLARPTRRLIPVDVTHHSYCRENHKSYVNG